MKESKTLKKRAIRHNEYYSMQNILDALYMDSKNNCRFTNLMEIITSELNILLSYRNIKRNHGSITVGTDNLNIEFFEKMNSSEMVKYIQRRFNSYTPKSVRRVYISKDNHKTRPLGIPCIADRLMQQCIKQVLEPICEAKFHNHSYGFRPNRSTKHAIARCMFLMNKSNFHYAVDIDIKGFFDNVNHSKLKKQIWNLGIQDKNLISIIGKILKSEIQGEGIPMKGTPQGGIISPLFSNIVLNELDWWISNQWETFETKHQYSDTNKYRAIKKSKLKEVFLVRYADDFKILCKNYKTAQKIYNATRLWLKERLNLDISPEKSKVTNLRKNYTEFLGFKLMAKPKKNKYVCQSHMSDKAIAKVTRKIKEQIKIIQKCPNGATVNKLNSIILGVHNYYKTATNVSLDMSKINFLVLKSLDIRCRTMIKDNPKYTDTYIELYGKYKGKVRTIAGITIYPIYGCTTSPPMNFIQGICNYTERGRTLVHTKLKGYNHLIQHLLKTCDSSKSAEYFDNRISLIVGQQGRCGVTGLSLEIDSMECHHKQSKALGGVDKYDNLIWVSYEIHKLIHSTKQDTINKYLGKISLNKKQFRKLNSLRLQVGNSVI